MKITLRLEKLRLCDRREAKAMEGAGPIFAQGKKMLGRGVTLVATKSVLRVESVDFFHDSVAGDLGDDAGRRNRKAEFVAVNNGSVRGGEVGHATPSIKTCSGDEGKALIAWHIARCVAWRILILSMVTTSCTDTAQCTCVALAICMNSSARNSGVSFLESFRPPKRRCSRKMTAAATTGPARGPRPASSIPAMRRMPRFLRARSCPNEQGIGQTD